MAEPKWISRLLVDAIHQEQLGEHGGLHGTKDENALESALARPRQKLAYEPDTDLPTLAAAYGFGLARNHPYVDGNKRVAFMAMYTFLGLNGHEIEAEEEDVVRVMLAVAAGEWREDQLADWVRGHIQPLSE